jgi:hypothetical protein
MPYFLFLDDQRSVDEDVKYPTSLDTLERKVAKNYKEFTEIVQKFGVPEAVSFDMDLCPEHYRIGAANGFSSLLGYERAAEKTGLDCAKFLTEYCTQKKTRLNKWFVHSQNIAGGKAIRQHLTNFTKTQNQNGT